MSLYKKNNMSAIAVRVNKEVKNDFYSRAKTNGHSAASVLKKFIYDYIGEKEDKSRSIKNMPTRSGFYFTTDVFSKLDAICSKEGTSKSEILNELMRRYIQDNE